MKVEVVSPPGSPGLAPPSRRSRLSSLSCILAVCSCIVASMYAGQMVNLDFLRTSFRVSSVHPTPSSQAASSATVEPPNIVLSVDAETVAELRSRPYTSSVYDAVMAGRDKRYDNNTVDVMVVPLFHDGEEVKGLLQSVDTGVRLFVFVCNSDDPVVLDALRHLAKLPFGVAVVHHPENAGFSGAVNEGIRKGIAMLRDPPARWFFIVNADTEFPPKALGSFATVCNSVWATHGLAYGPRQDHFAFVITRTAVDRVGMMDEVFFPGYMEDIDYHWRVHLGGLPQTITGINFHHHHSVNLRKPNTGEYQHQLTRASRGWEYGWMKWGRYDDSHIENPVPPSGWKTPFNIPNASLSLWVIDPAHRECVRTGHGTFHVTSSTCWYNGNVLLDVLPRGTTLSPQLASPYGQWQVSAILVLLSISFLSSVPTAHLNHLFGGSKA